MAAQQGFDGLRRMRQENQWSDSSFKCVCILIEACQPDSCQKGLNTGIAEHQLLSVFPPPWLFWALVTNQLLSGWTKRRGAAHWACFSGCPGSPFHHGNAAAQLFSESPVHSKNDLWKALLALFEPPQLGTKQDMLWGKLMMRMYVAEAILWVDFSGIPGMV